MFRTIVFVALFVSGDCEKYFREHRHKHEGHHDFATSPRHRGPESERRVVSNRSSSQNCVQIGLDNKTERPERVVGIKTIRPSTHTQTFYYDNDCCYNFEVNVPIEFTCWLRDVAYIRWTGHGIKTEWVASDSLTLLLTPDDDDRNLNLNCKGAPAPNEWEISKKITITLDLSMPSNTYITKTRRFPLYLEKGKSWSMNSPCQVLISKLGKDNSVIYHYLPNPNNVIENFDEVQNGTEFFCIKLLQPQSTYNMTTKKRITTFERIKTRYIFYLYEETQKYTRRSPAGGEFTEMGNSLKVKNDDSGSSTVITVFVIGVIVVVSLGLGVMLGMCCKYKFRLVPRRTQNNIPRQVVYAEIDKPADYAEILGYLIPRPRAPSEHIYATIDEMGNPYAVVDIPYVYERST